MLPHPLANQTLKYDHFYNIQVNFSLPVLIVYLCQLVVAFKCLFTPDTYYVKIIKNEVDEF